MLDQTQTNAENKQMGIIHHVSRNAGKHKPLPKMASIMAPNTRSVKASEQCKKERGPEKGLCSQLVLGVMVIAMCTQQPSKNAANTVMPRHQCHFCSVIVLVSSLSPATDPAVIVSILTVIMWAKLIDRYNAVMRCMVLIIRPPVCSPVAK